MNIGKRVKEIRENRGIKAVFVARQIGVSPATISEIEREKCNPTVTQLVALADFYGVTTDYLIKGN
jgi:transcriptional regulator with XRE-family HTH domain